MPIVYPVILPPGATAYLIRHDYSMAQKNEQAAADLPDMLVNVAKFDTPLIFETAAILQKELAGQDPSQILSGHSPYFRSVKTHEPIVKICDPDGKWNYLGSDMSLREIEFGLNDGLSVDARKRRAGTNPVLQIFQDHQDKHFMDDARNAGANVFMRHPMGESNAAVYDRVRPSLIIAGNTMLQLGCRIYNSFTHGGVNRAEAAALLAMTAEEFGGLRNPENCEIWKVVIPSTPYERPLLTSLTHPHLPILTPKVVGVEAKPGPVL